MKRKRKIIIGIIISLIIVLFFFFFFFLKDDDKDIREQNNIEEIEDKTNDKIEEKEDAHVTEQILSELDLNNNMLIYITSSGSCEYNQCVETDEFIKLYEQNYQLNFKYFDQNITSNADFKRLLKKFDIKEDYLIAPAVIFVKDGKKAGVANQIISDSSLRKMLFQFGFLDKKYDDSNKEITLKQLQKKLSSTEKSLVLFYNSSNESNEIRKLMLELSTSYSFEYNLVFYGLEVSMNLSELFENNFKDGVDMPLLTIISDDKFVNYTNEYSKEAIVNFLRKNNLI